MAWSTQRKTGASRTVGLVAALALCGCEDIDWDWELQEWTQVHRPIRPSRRRAPADYSPHRPRVRTGSTGRQAQAGEADRRGPPGLAARSGDSPDRPAPSLEEDRRAYYHLYLISDRASLKAPPNSKKIRLAQAQSRPAVDVLHMIYPSIGPSGGEGHRFLVYQHEAMWSGAAEFASLLDCPERAEPPPADPTDPVAAFQAGVGLFYRLKQPGQPTDFDGLKRCVGLMERAFGSDEGSGQLRWGAAMLAGRITSETLSEFARARRYFRQAKGFALPGSVEEMIAVYYLADTHVHEGQRDQALRLVQGLIKQFVSHRASYVYERASGLTKPR